MIPLHSNQKLDLRQSEVVAKEVGVDSAQVTAEIIGAHAVVDEKSVDKAEVEANIARGGAEV